MRLKDHCAASEAAVKADDGPLLATDVDGVAALEMRWRAMRLALMAKDRGVVPAAVAVTRSPATRAGPAQDLMSAWLRTRRCVVPACRV